MPETDYGLAKYWMPNFSVHIEKQVCSCGAWQLGKVKDPGDRYKLLETLIRSVKDLDSIIFEVSPGLKSTASQRWHFG